MAQTVSQSAAIAAAQCPHAIFHNVLGTKMVADLLGFVAARQPDFESARVRNRKSGHIRVDYDLRGSLTIKTLGDFAAPLAAFVNDITRPTLAQLQIKETDVEPKEFEVNAYRDGTHFGAHIDTSERLARVRVLSCVYYFAVTPRRFSGGELRLFAMPTLSAAKGAKSGQTAFVDVAPDTDTMVVFPSWLRHEVLPVSVPSQAWIDSRFTLNCWLHRRQ